MYSARGWWWRVTFSPSQLQGWLTWVMVDDALQPKRLPTAQRTRDGPETDQCALVYGVLSATICILPVRKRARPSKGWPENLSKIPQRPLSKRGLNRLCCQASVGENANCQGKCRHIVLPAPVESRLWGCIKPRRFCVHQSQCRKPRRFTVRAAVLSPRADGRPRGDGLTT